MHTTSSLSNNKVWHCKQNPMASYTNCIFPLAVLSLFLLPFPSHSSDPSPLQDFCVADWNSSIFVNGYPCKDPSEVTRDDFFYSGFTKEAKEFPCNGAYVEKATVKEFAGLNTLGMSMYKVTLRPKGYTLYHYHPRAAELLVVVEGNIVSGFGVDDNTAFAQYVSRGELFVIPPGAIHLQVNAGSGNATFYSSHNSHNPGMTSLNINTKNCTPDGVLSKDLLAIKMNINDLIKSKISEKKR